MRARHSASIACALALLMAAPTALAGAAGTDEAGVAFRVRTIVSRDGSSRAVSDATVEGPGGTDIALESRTAPFAMSARLKTDALADGRVRIVAVVTTRRSAGVSSRGFALFEEDARRAVVEVATDGSESLVVLPFGKNPGGEELSVDVEPRSIRRPAGAPLDIRIDDAGTDGWLRVSASKTPHRYAVEATLERSGVVVAGGSSVAELEEPCDVPLLGDAGNRGADLRLTVDGYEQTCPSERIRVSFDVSGPSGVIETGWSGVTSSSEALEYPLRDDVGGRLAGSPSRLRIRVSPMEEDR